MFGPGGAIFHLGPMRPGGDRTNPIYRGAYGFAAEIRPQTASKVWDISGYDWGDQEWLAHRRGSNAVTAPMAKLEYPSRLKMRAIRGG